MDQQSGEHDSPLVLAEAELDRWCEHYAALIGVDAATWEDARAAILTGRELLPVRLACRLYDALGGCATTADVRMVFASVQEQQLCSAS